MILLLDKNEELTRSIDCYDITRTRELNGENTLEIESNEEIIEGDRVLFKDDLNKWNEYIISSVDIERDNEVRYIAYGEDSSYELFYTYVDDLKPRDENAKTLLSRLLEDTRFEVGFVEDVGNISTNFYHTNVRNCIYRIVEILGCDIDYTIKVEDNKIVGRYVNLYKKIGSNNGKRFTYKKDLNNIKKTIDYSNICSKLYGYGKGEEIVEDDYDITTDNSEKESKYGRRINFADVNGGKKYVENNDTRLKYGIGIERKHLESIFVAEDCEDKEELLRLTKEELEKRSRPKISYDINVEDISKYQDMGGIVEGVGLGDEVLISDKSINEKVLTRVIKIVDHPFTGEDIDITLGNYFINLADNLAELEKLRQLIERREKLLGEEIKRLATMTNKGFLRSVTDLLNKELNDTDGFVYFIPDKGIRIYNKPIDANPTKCIELGGGHLRIANKKLANGEFDFTTFGTGDGFTASLIVAGILKGGKVEFDLENGTFLIGESKEKFSMLWDGETLKLRNVDIDLSNNYQIGEINDKIEENTDNFNNSIVSLDDKFGTSITGLDTKLTGLSTSVDTKFLEATEDVDNKLDELDGSFDTKISNITGEIESVRQDFKVGQGEFKSTINTKIKDLTADVEVNFKDVNKRIAGNVTGIANLDSKIEQTESSITQSVSNQIKAVNDKIDDETDGVRSYVQKNYSTKTQTADLISDEIGSVKEVITSTDGATRKYIKENYSTTLQTADLISDEIGCVKKLITDGDDSVKTYLQKNYSTTLQTNKKISNEIGSVKKLITSTDGATRKHIKENYSTTLQTNEKISSEIKSLKSYVDTVDSDKTSFMLEHFSTKIQTDRMIENRVGSIDNRLFVAESDIRQTADKIESKVSSSEAKSIFRQEADKFTFKASQIDFIDSNVNIRGQLRNKGERYSYITEKYESVDVYINNGGIDFYRKNLKESSICGVGGAGGLQIEGKSVSIGSFSEDWYKGSQFINIDENGINMDGKVTFNSNDVVFNSLEASVISIGVFDILAESNHLVVRDNVKDKVKRLFIELDW